MLDFFTQMMGSASPIALNQGIGQSSFPASLIQSESGGNWGALNNERGSGGVRGHGGRLQFGDARLTDAARAGVIPRLSPDQFARQSPRIQRRVEEWHFRDIDDQIRRRGLDRFVGEEIDGQPVTMDAMRSVAHLGGMGGLQKFLETGGRHNPQDSFGTSLSDYHRRHGGGQANQPRRADMPAQGAMPASMERPMQPQPRQFDQRFGQMFDEQGMGQGRPIPQAPQPRRTAEAERVEPVEVPPALMDSRPISGRSDMMEPGRRLAPEPQGNEGFRVPGGPGPRPDMVSPPADMPARGARPQSGQLPPPPEDPDRRAMGVEPRQSTGLLGNLFGGGRQQGNQQGGERQGFMSPAMSDFFTAMGESLLTSPGHSPLAGFPRAMQGLRLASQEREKSAAEQRALAAVLRQSGMPDELIQEVIVSPQAAKMAFDQFQTMQAQQREAQNREQFLQAYQGAPGGQSGAGAAPQGRGQVQGQGQSSLMSMPRNAPPVGRFESDAQPQAMPSEQAPSVDLESPEFERLMTERARVLELAERYPSEANTNFAKRKVDAIDMRLDRMAPTSAQKEYVFDMQQRQAMGLPREPFREWEAERAERQRAQTVVNNNAAPQVGNLRPGERLQVNDDGSMEIVEIPGGEVERERREAERRAAGRSRATQQAGGTVVQDLGRALNLAPNMVRGDGVVGANARLALARVPGTTEYTINSFKESALSNIGLDTLQRMRENNDTGGALGQVPIQQQARLEQVLGSLDLGQSPEIIEDNMKRVMNIYTDIMFGDEGERAVAVEEGRMTQEEADRISGMYYDLSFDDRGAPINRQSSPSRRLRFNPETGELE